MPNASGPFLKFTEKMPAALKYIVDENGHKSLVLVPVKVSEELNAKYLKLQNKLDVLNGMREGLDEVKEAKKSGRKLQTLKDFFK